MKKYVQCPRCELNYITTPGDKYCKVCMREMKGEGGQDDVEMCSVCNENPALPGRDICLFCLKEMNAQAAESVGAASDDSGDGDGEQVTPRSLTDMDTPLHIYPGGAVDLETALEAPGTKVLMKSGKSIHAAAETLSRMGLADTIAMVANCGLPNQQVFETMQDLPDESPYFATVLVP